MPIDKNKQNNSSSETLRTTASERKKAKLVQRCFINLLKCWRVCVKTRKDKISV